MTPARPAWDLRQHDSRQPWPIAPGSVHLVFGSPPYFGADVAITYDQHDYAPSLTAWAEDLAAVSRQAYQALADGGRLVVNVANSGRKPYHDLAGLVGVTLAGAGFELRGHIIWHKGYGVAGTAWGSTRMASAPSLRDVHEYLIVGQKGAGPLAVAGFPRRDDLTGGEFGRLTFSIWEVSVTGREPWQRACKHPAPYPLELARRLVRLYTAPGMTVLDPWAGAGTSCAAALSQGCHAVGYDLSQPYLEAARAWCSEVQGKFYRPRPEVMERDAPELPLLALAGAAGFTAMRPAANGRQDSEERCKSGLLRPGRD